MTPLVWENKLADSRMTTLEIIKMVCEEYRDEEIKYSDILGSLIRNISYEIPIILHLDEFQTTVGVIFDEYIEDFDERLSKLKSDNQKRNYRWQATKHLFLSLLCSEQLMQRVFAIITGTKYTIMRELGYSLGSPLKGKVEHIVLPPLN
ncbi:MAG: hypothetical protein ACTSRZ_20660, partial [Promethearchaeota archaeon]